MTKEYTPAWLRTQTFLNEKQIYADTATSGILYDGLLEWRRQHDQGFYQGASTWKMDSHILLKETREAVASFFGGHPEWVALTPNFSIGLNFLVESLDPAMRVLLLEADYPSVNWPFQSRGFTCTRVACDEQLEGRISEALAMGNYDVLALSLVQWVNGIMVSPAFLAGLKRQYPDLLIIADGTQFCGAFSLDFGSSGIDVLGASGYKWLMSGYGNAFFLFKKGAERWFMPKVTGFNASGGDLGRQHELKFPRQLEPGHLDTLNFGSLKFSLGVLAAMGKDAIEQHNWALCARLQSGLTELGLLEDAVTGRERHGNIYNIRGGKPLFTYLRAHGVVCALRGKGIRLSLHCYNTPAEATTIIGLLYKYHKSLPALK